MNRYHGQFSGFSRGRKAPLLIVALALMLSACGDGGNPRPPQSPPRPVTEFGYISTAQFEMSARPVAPPPGEM